ncbi:MAG: hypothetical protein J6M66_09770 [Lachnospiraceae bacterium]|nr:hypothetical protein [Lachnospiraceae bacterium]
MADFYENGVRKLEIVTDDGISITDSTEFRSEEFSMTENLCSKQQLRYGCCEAAFISFKISYVHRSLKGKWLTVRFRMMDDSLYQIGRYKVDSDIPTADRQFRKITAYDVMYDILNTDIAEWYNTIFPGDNTKVSYKNLRDSFFEYIGVAQETVSLPQDSVMVQKSVDVIRLNGQYIIKAICEINGCFGHIDRSGKFQYVYLDELTASSGYIDIDRSIRKKDAQYEDFVTQKVDCLKLYQTDSEEPYVYGEGSNAYSIEDNMFLYGYTDAELEAIAENLYPIISKISYRPLTSISVKGDPTLPLGQGLRIVTKYETIYTYILERTMKGILFPTDTYAAKGREYVEQQKDNVDRQIVALKGKINQIDKSAFHFNVVRNGKAVEIGDGKNRRVIRADIMTGQDAQIKVEIQINLDLIIATGQEKAVCTVTYALGGNLLDTTPVETWSESGKHILSLMYFMNISDSGFHTFDLFLSMSGGSVAIAALDALEIFTGTNLVENPGWSGRLELLDDAPVFEIPHIGFDVDAYTESISTVLITPDRVELRDTAPVFEIPQISFSASDYEDDVGFGDYVVDMTWEEVKVSTWGTIKENYIWGQRGES